MTNEEAIKRLTDILDEVTEDKNAICYVTNYDEETLKMAIKALSTEKTAEWEFPQSRCAKCSYCGHIIYETIYRYCPNCGSKMKGEE